MIYSAVGDLARATNLRSRSGEMQNELSKLVSELGSGRAEDTTGHLKANFSHLSYIEHGLSATASYRSAAHEAASFMQAAQAGLGQIAQKLEDVTKGLLTDGVSGLEGTAQHISEQAEAGFTDMISVLNLEFGGRSVFAGAASDGPAFAEAEDILGDLRAAVSGLTSFADVEAAIEVWFTDPGGGFSGMAYQGSDEAIGAFDIGPDRELGFDVTGAHPAFAQGLKALAYATLAGTGALAADDDLRRAMLSKATELTLFGKDLLTQVQAQIGFKEAEVEREAVRLEAQDASLRIAQSDLLNADLYETAIRLEETQMRLESLYSATSRLSALSLVRFLQ